MTFIGVAAPEDLVRQQLAQEPFELRAVAATGILCA